MWKSIKIISGTPLSKTAKWIPPITCKEWIVLAALTLKQNMNLDELRASYHVCSYRWCIQSYCWVKLPKDFLHTLCWLILEVQSSNRQKENTREREEIVCLLNSTSVSVLRGRVPHLWTVNVIWLKVFTIASDLLKILQSNERMLSYRRSTHIKISVLTLMLPFFFKNTICSKLCEIFQTIKSHIWIVSVC